MCHCAAYFISTECNCHVLLYLCTIFLAYVSDHSARNYRSTRKSESLNHRLFQSAPTFKTLLPARRRGEVHGCNSKLRGSIDSANGVTTC